MKKKITPQLFGCLSDEEIAEFGDLPKAVAKFLIDNYPDACVFVMTELDYVIPVEIDGEAGYRLNPDAPAEARSPAGDAAMVNYLSRHPAIIQMLRALEVKPKRRAAQ